MKKHLVAVAAAVGVVAATLLAAPAANAEPVCDGYTAVGSDTIQDVMNALANGYSPSAGVTVRSSGLGSPVCNYDAFPAQGLTAGLTSTIQVHANGPWIKRPNGSTSGRKALNASSSGVAISMVDTNHDGIVNSSDTATSVAGMFDIARSSSGAGASALSSTADIPSDKQLSDYFAYYAFARDAIGFATNVNLTTNPDLRGITLQEMKDLYKCVITSIDGVSVTPVIPQAGSGTREFVLGKLGITDPGSDAGLQASYPCLAIGQEHDTRALFNGSPMPANSIVAMSASQWTAQNTGAGFNRVGAGFVLGSLVEAATVASPTDTFTVDHGSGTLTFISPVTGSGASMSPVTSYYSSTTWGRDTYLVTNAARTAVSSPTFDSGLADLLGITNVEGQSASSIGAAKLLNQNVVAPNAAGVVKKKFGFLPTAQSPTLPVFDLMSTKSGTW